MNIRKLPPPKMPEELRAPCDRILAYLRTHGTSSAEQIMVGAEVYDPQFGRCIDWLEDDQIETEFRYRLLPKKIAPIKGR